MVQLQMWKQNNLVFEVQFPKPSTFLSTNNDRSITKIGPTRMPIKFFSRYASLDSCYPIKDDN